MDKHYSEIYSHDYSDDMKNQLFRYNYKSHNLEKVYIPDKDELDMLKDDLNSNIDSMRLEAQADLKSYEETGYLVVAAIGLSEESWKEAKDYYMDNMCEELAYVYSDAVEEFATEIVKKEGKEMKTAKNTSLASELNELAKGLDYYEYMDNYNSKEEGLQYFTECLNNKEQTKAILDHLRESQEETPDIWGPKELEVLQHLEKYASQQFQFPDMFSISEEDITKLVKAGDWHIDEEDHERFADADDPRVTGSIGYVSFGNYFYDFRCLDYSPESKNFAVDICELRPAEDIGQTTHKFLKDGMPYTFEAIDVDDLEEKYLPGMNAYVIMERNDYNSESLENFKRDVVKALATGGAEHQKPLIDANLADEYLSLKEPGTGFPQYYEKRKKILEHLQEYECNPRKVYAFLPEDTTQLIYKDKLTPEQIDTLGNYYEHFRECYTDTCLDYTANKRMLVRKMAADGLDDSKISMINTSIFERFERFRTSISKPVFKQTISDLIKETRAANAARWTDKSKNFGK